MCIFKSRAARYGSPCASWTKKVTRRGKSSYSGISYRHKLLRKITPYCNFIRFNRKFQEGRVGWVEGEGRGVGCVVKLTWAIIATTISSTSRSKGLLGRWHISFLFKLLFLVGLMMVFVIIIHPYGVINTYISYIRCRHGRKKWSVHVRVREKLKTSYLPWRQVSLYYYYYY